VGLVLYASKDFPQYISVYAAIVAICSTALLAFLLPKLFDYFNNLNYRNYKELLDLQKSLIDSNRVVDSRIHKMIDHYEQAFIEARQKKAKKPNFFGFYISAVGLLIFIFCVVIAILVFSMEIYQHLFLDFFVH
jgi:hypothetical protein